MSERRTTASDARLRLIWNCATDVAVAQSAVDASSISCLSGSEWNDDITTLNAYTCAPLAVSFAEPPPDSNEVIQLLYDACAINRPFSTMHD